MDFSALDIALLIGAYLLGAAPFGFLMARSRGVDIRTVGSGNIGATNVGRVLGVRLGLAVFAFDVLKGFLPTFLALKAHGVSWGSTEIPLFVALVGLAAIAGHNWPVYLRFRGGKGVATSCGVFIALFWPGLLISVAVWGVVVALTRYVSLGSIFGGWALLGSALWLQDDAFGGGKFLTAFAALGAILAIVRHRSNIARLLRGAEKKIGGKDKGQ